MDSFRIYSAKENANSQLFRQPQLALDMRAHSQDSTIIDVADEVRAFVSEVRRQFLDLIDEINEADSVGPRIYAYEGLVQAFDGKEAELSISSKNYEHGWFREIEASPTAALRLLASKLSMMASGRG